MALAGPPKTYVRESGLLSSTRQGAVIGGYAIWSGTAMFLDALVIGC
jgi:hypothetical protein